MHYTLDYGCYGPARKGLLIIWKTGFQVISSSSLEFIQTKRTLNRFDRGFRRLGG